MQDARIKDSAIARLGCDPLGIFRELVGMAKKGNKTGQEIPLPNQFSSQLCVKPVTLSNKTEARLAFFVALQEDTHTHNLVRVSRFIPIRTNAVGTVDILLDAMTSRRIRRAGHYVGDIGCSDLRVHELY